MLWYTGFFYAIEFKDIFLLIFALTSSSLVYSEMILAASKSLKSQIKWSIDAYYYVHILFAEDI